MQLVAAPTELADSLYERVRDLTLLVRREAATDLSIAAVSVLARLRDEGPARITGLAERERVAQPSMTALVGRLEARGVVARSPDPDDGRAVRVSLTPAGEERLAAVRRGRAEVLAERLSTLDAPARERIAAALPDLDRLLTT
jgi:DNA-binding MarR family transcriptional regulator